MPDDIPKTTTLAAHIVLMPRSAPPADAAPPVPTRRVSPTRSQALPVLMGLASVFALQWAKPVLVSILLAVLLSYAVEPMVHRLVHWRMPRAAAASLVFAATISAVAALGYAFSYQLAAAADRLPSAAQELREAIEQRGSGAPGTVAKVQQAANELQKLSGADPPATEAAPKMATVAVAKKPFDLGAYLWEGSISVTTLIGDTVVILCLALYLSVAGDMFRRRFVEIAGPRLSEKKVTLQILDAISLQIARYLFVRGVISGMVALGTFAAFWGIGVAQPAVWGLAAGLFNVIPYFGPLAIVAAAGVAGFVQFHTLSMGVLAAGLATAVACLEAYAVTPWLMSRTADMNAAVVFMGLLFWGWLWGLPGLFLAVPILMVIKAVSDHIEVFHPVATLLKG